MKITLFLSKHGKKRMAEKAINKEQKEARSSGKQRACWLCIGILRLLIVCWAIMRIKSKR
jgi:hypothetical protein